MKSIVTNYRYWVLALLAAVAAIGLLAVPQDGIGAFRYIAVLLGTKTVGLLALIGSGLLFLRWKDAGEIPELTGCINGE